MLGNRNSFVVALVALSPIGLCQDSSSQLDARGLVYREQADTDQLPPVSSIKHKAKPPTPPKADKGSVHPAQVPVPTSQPAPIPAAVQHLGFRLNVLKVDDNGAVPADPDGNFHNRDCIQFEFMPNRTSYLYVIAQGSSKVWQPLLPSADLPDESNVVRSRTTVRVPSNSCFEINDPPGVEHFFIVLSRNPEELVDLDDAIRNGRSAPARLGSPPPVLTASNFDAALKPWSELQGRDIKVRKMKPDEALAPGEAPGSVYVTNASYQPSDRLVYQVDIRHTN